MSRMLYFAFLALASLTARAQAQEDCEKLLDCAQLAVEAAQHANDRMEAIEARLPLIQSGEIIPNKDEAEDFKNNAKSLDQNGRCIEGEKAHRGVFRRYVKFDQPYREPPQVVLSLNQIGSVGPIRVQASHFDVTQDGFTASIITFCDTRIYWVKMSWIAIGT